MIKYHLNLIKISSEVTFLKAKKGVVIGIWEKCGIAGSDDVASMRLCIKHEGSTSYHTYRHDGKSNECYTHDMLSVDGIRLVNR